MYKSSQTSTLFKREATICYYKRRRKKTELCMRIYKHNCKLIKYLKKTKKNNINKKINIQTFNLKSNNRHRQYRREREKESESDKRAMRVIKPQKTQENIHVFFWFVLFVCAVKNIISINTIPIYAFVCMRARVFVHI